MKPRTILILCFVLLLAACTRPQIIAPRPISSSPQEPTISYHAQGLASWYGGKFHGRKTASGEKFDKNDFTCAHRTLPFGTLLKVTNLANEKSVTVRVSDRGPAIKSRLIDVSQAAARDLEMLGTGTAEVFVESLDHEVPQKEEIDYE
ncbi:MAG: septal ring lytic transglycosylase RlpA family protein [Deltaproteobacteria bacterium]|nr:MAG: septal ring lytic transglycosylase RlpA family protein [Deltaproteobacteria bacterium]